LPLDEKEDYEKALFSNASKKEKKIDPTRVV
jgi:hypothetical protein